MVWSKLLNQIVTSCPIMHYNFAEPMIAAVFTAVRKSPYKYAELLTVFEKIATLNQNSDYMREYMSNNLTNICQLLRQWLEGKWEDSEFLQYFLKLLSSMLNFARRELMQKPDFEIISAKLVHIYVEYNCHENRRDILKLWTQQVQLNEFWTEPKIACLCPTYVETAIRCLENCASSSILEFVACLINALVIDSADVLLQYGVTRQMVNLWIRTGLSNIHA